MARPGLVVGNVLSLRTQSHVATINHGFDPPAGDDLTEQTFLDPLNRQSKWSEALLDLFVNVVLADSAYQQRLLRHYRLIKDAVAGPAHPLTHEFERYQEDAKALWRRLQIPPPRRGKRKWR